MDKMAWERTSAGTSAGTALATAKAAKVMAMKLVSCMLAVDAMCICEDAVSKTR
jgi:hypothetical protein